MKTQGILAVSPNRFVNGAEVEQEIFLQRFDSDSLDQLKVPPVVRQNCQIVMERGCTNEQVEITDNLFGLP